MTTLTARVNFLSILEPGIEFVVRLRAVYEPNVDYSALVAGAMIQVMEGPRVVATGSIVNEGLPELAAR